MEQLFNKDFPHFVIDDERELNGHPDHEDIKRQRSLGYNNGVDAYANMWTAAGKWGAMVKEEPKGSSAPSNLHSNLPEILSNNPSAPPPAPSSGGSPHHPHQFSYGSPNPSTGFPDVVFTSSATTPSDLIYDSINMTQVQNYSPSLSSSLGKDIPHHLCSIDPSIT